MNESLATYDALAMVTFPQNTEPGGPGIKVCAATSLDPNKRIAREMAAMAPDEYRAIEAECCKRRYNE